MRQSHLAALLLAAAASVAHASTYYIAPTGGSDAGAGSQATPFASFSHALSIMNPGDTLLVRGGSYALNTTISISSSKNGTAALPYTIQAFTGESPVLDFSTQATGSSNRGISLSGNYWTIRGLAVQNAGDNGVIIAGSNNLIDRLSISGCRDSGLQISGSASQHPANNLILNTDSFKNYDPATHGENADGFAAKFRELGAGNVFQGCRSFQNADDGWDFWGAANGVTLKNCWSFKNGFNIFNDNAWAGDGNGFKLGHDSGTHVLQNLLSWGNRLNGVDVNGNATTDPTILNSSGVYVPIAHGVTLDNVTALNNGAGGNGFNFNFDEAVAAYPHTLLNDISFSQSGVGTSGGATGVNIFAGNIANHDTWTGLGVTTSDFLSLDDTTAAGPRLPDGSLPTSTFLHLAPTSHLIDAGIAIPAIPFNGPAPDLGAFETPEPTTLPLLLPLLAALKRRGRR